MHKQFRYRGDVTGTILTKRSVDYVHPGKTDYKALCAKLMNKTGKSKMINYRFIEALEGKKLEGYVPNQGNSNSGITIASGFDLGQQTTSGLTELFDDTSLITKLACYTNKRQKNAVEHLWKYPLKITEEECELINKVVFKKAKDILIKRWKSAKPKCTWDKLTGDKQTVIFSVAFQYGNLMNRTPNFWQQVITSDWDAALANLRDFQDKYPTRRNKEADLLEGKS